MEFRQTIRQVARSTRADAETGAAFFLIKIVSEMRATYQVRLLVFRAAQERRKVVIQVPEGCKIHRTLRDLSHQVPKTIQITRT
jgi:hypothetical protein